jgi:hypothetical protein
MVMGSKKGQKWPVGQQLGSQEAYCNPTEPQHFSVFLDFSGHGRFNPGNSRKDVLFDPPPGT